MFKKINHYLLIMIALILLSIGHSAISIWDYSHHNQLVKSDAAIVLGAAVWDDKPHQF